MPEPLILQNYAEFVGGLLVILVLLSTIFIFCYRLKNSRARDFFEFLIRVNSISPQEKKELEALIKYYNIKKPYRLLISERLFTYFINKYCDRYPKKKDILIPLGNRLFQSA